jgi:hypothetical protein
MLSAIWYLESALPKAGSPTSRHVRYVPKADIRSRNQGLRIISVE